MDRELVAAYAAGLIDGEGCISSDFNYTQQRTGTKSLSWSLTIQIGMNSRLGLDRIAEAFGGRVRGPDYRGTYNWGLYGRTAWPFLEAIQPYSLVKAEHIKLALSWLQAKDSYGNVDHIIRENIYDSFKKLNRPGRSNHFNASRYPAAV